MPELPEVETTTRGLQKEIVGLKILDAWTDLNTADKRKNDTMSNPRYFQSFRKEVKNKKILSVERRAKNILINLSQNKTILIHLKMTGCLFVFSPRSDIRNPKRSDLLRFIHVIFYLSNKKQLAFSDVRKFGKITLLDTDKAFESKHLKNLGPEPLKKQFTINNFKLRINTKPNGKIKTVLIDQTIVAGIGNIYSDEILWLAGIHPERMISKINETEFKKIFKAMKETLKRGIHLGGDSTSDYLNIYGLPGEFQLYHNAYQRTREKCRKKGCQGTILKKVINGRSAHFCSVHQK